MKKFLVFFLTCLVWLPSSAQTLQEQYQKHIRYLTSEELGGRRAQTRGDTLAMEYIRGQLAAIEGITLLGEDGVQPFVFMTRASRGDTTRTALSSFNVVGLIEAADPAYRKRTLVLGAHYDHLGVRERDGLEQLHPGADDNASGTAFVIETARELAGMRERLKTNVLILLFGAEELGLQGSRYYVNHPLQPLDEIKAMLNFDMLGRMNARGHFSIRGAGSAREGLCFFGEHKNPDGLELVFDLRGNGPTDYASFYAKGIPAFSYTTDHHDDLHRPSDTEDKINYPGMEKARNYIWQSIEALAFTEKELTFKKANE